MAGSCWYVTRPQTLHGYRQIVRDHITPSLGRYKPGALRPDAIQRPYADERLRSERHERT